MFQTVHAERQCVFSVHAESRKLLSAVDGAPVCVISYRARLGSGSNHAHAAITALNASSGALEAKPEQTPNWLCFYESIIAGGGIGGLTAALSLHKVGIDVTVYEAVEQLEPLGVGINILPRVARADRTRSRTRSRSLGNPLPR